MSLVVPQVYCWGMYPATEVSPFSANRFNTGSPKDTDGYLQHRQGSKLLGLGYKSDFLDYGEHGEAMGSAKTVLGLFKKYRPGLSKARTISIS